MIKDKTFRAEFDLDVGRLITDVTLNTAKGEFKALALWDTGAPDSYIDSNLAEKIEAEKLYEGKQIDIFNVGHTNTYQSYMYVIDKLSINQYINITNFPVIGANIYNPQLEFDMIIGLDIITSGQFSLNIDYEKRKLIMTFNYDPLLTPKEREERFFNVMLEVDE